MAFAALQLVALIARSLAEARALPNHGMSPMKPQRYTDKERSLGLLASVNLGVLQWVSADGHCFFYAVAAKLKELRFKRMCWRPSLMTACLPPTFTLHWRAWALPTRSPTRAT